MKEKINIELKDYYHNCGDGCCTTYGTIVTVNGVEMPCHNTDTATIVQQILEHLGHEVEIEHITED